MPRIILNVSLKSANLAVEIANIEDITMQFDYVFIKVEIWKK